MFLLPECRWLFYYEDMESANIRGMIMQITHPKLAAKRLNKKAIRLRRMALPIVIGTDYLKGDPAN